MKDVLAESMQTDEDVQENVEVLQATIESLKSDLAHKDRLLRDAVDSQSKNKVPSHLSYPILPFYLSI